MVKRIYLYLVQQHLHYVNGLTEIIELVATTTVMGSLLESAIATVHTKCICKTPQFNCA